MAIGLDWGTSTVVAARSSDGEDQAKYRLQRNCYIPVDATDDMKNWLRQTKMNFVEFDDDPKVYVIGEHSMQLGSSLGTEVLRPMAAGVMKGDARATGIMKAIAQSVLGEPKEENELCVFSVPADPIDDDFKTFYHENITKMGLQQLGWNPQSINEALAIVYSENPKMETDSGEEAEFTGIGISCGGGMINICVAFRGLPTITFSLANAHGMGEGSAGDWIDQQIFKQFKDQFGTIGRVTLYKEQFADFTKDPLKDPEYVAEVAEKARVNNGQTGWHMEALASIKIFYEALLDYVIMKTAAQFEEKRPTLEGALQVVVGGGTSSPPGFELLLEERLKRHSLPFAVRGVSKSGNPIRTVARGALVAGEVGFGG